MQSLGLFIIFISEGITTSPFQHFSWQCVFFYCVLLDLVLSLYTRMHRIALLVTFDLIFNFHTGMQTFVLSVILGASYFHPVHCEYTVPLV